MNPRASGRGVSAVALLAHCSLSHDPLAVTATLPSGLPTLIRPHILWTPLEKQGKNLPFQKRTLSPSERKGGGTSFQIHSLVCGRDLRWCLCKMYLARTNPNTTLSNVPMLPVMLGHHQRVTCKKLFKKHKEKYLQSNDRRWLT